MKEEKQASGAASISESSAVHSEAHGQGNEALDVGDAAHALDSLFEGSDTNEGDKEGLEAPPDAEGEAEQESDADDGHAWEIEVLRHGEKHLVKGKADIHELVSKGLDYGLKTRELAEQRKGLEEVLRQVEGTRQDYEQNLGLHATLRFVDSQLEEISKVDMAKLRDEDISRYEFYRDKRYDLERIKTESEKQLALSHAHQMEQVSRLKDEHIARANDALSHPKTGIKGWGPEIYGTLIDYGVSNGIDAGEMKSVINPYVMKIVHKAYLYDLGRKAIAGKREAPQKLPSGVRDKSASKHVPEAAARRFGATKSVRDAGSVINALLGQ